MVTIKKKTKDGRTYYYLEHAIRKGKKVQKKEEYLGKKLPENIEEIKKEFMNKIYKEKWFPLFDNVKRNFSEEWGKIPTSAKEKEIETFAIRFTYDTQKIEGSKLTLRETANLLEKGITPKEKSIRDVKEAEAHDKIFLEMLKSKKELSLQMILYWNKKLLENSKPDIAGKIREHQVKISGSKFMPPFPAEIYPLLRQFFKWYNKKRKKLHPIKLAALVHLKLVTIHPFTDGNGRISRLAMNFVLHKHNFPMLNILYEKRTGYYNSLERSQIKKIDYIFLQWFFKRYLKEHQRYLKKE